MSKIPDWKLERLHLGEIRDPALRDAAREQLEELSRSDAEILAAHPPAGVAAEVERRRRIEAARASVSAPRRNLFLLLPVGAMALAAALVLAPRQNVTTEAEDPEVILIKGDPRLLVYRQTASGAERLESGSKARAGDRLQLATMGGNARHGVVVSIDGRGGVTLHHPVHENGSTAIEAKETPLPSSYELDDAPDFERFFLVTGDAPISPARVLAAARDLVAVGRARTAPLPLPAGLGQLSMVVAKEWP